MVCFHMLCSLLNVLAHHLWVQFSKSTLFLAVIKLCFLALNRWQYTVVNEPDQETIEWFQVQKDASVVIDELAAV